MAHYAVSFDRDAATDLAKIRDYLADVRDVGFANDFADRVITTLRELRRAAAWRHAA